MYYDILEEHVFKSFAENSISCGDTVILRNVNTPTLRLEIWTFLVELLPEGYPNINIWEEFILV